MVTADSKQLPSKKEERYYIPETDTKAYNTKDIDKLLVGEGTIKEEDPKKSKKITRTITRESLTNIDPGVILYHSDHSTEEEGKILLNMVSPPGFPVPHSTADALCRLVELYVTGYKSVPPPGLPPYTNICKAIAIASDLVADGHIASWHYGGEILKNLAEHAVKAEACNRRFSIRTNNPHLERIISELKLSIDSYLGYIRRSTKKPSSVALANSLAAILYLLSSARRYSYEEPKTVGDAFSFTEDEMVFFPGTATIVAAAAFNIAINAPDNTPSVIRQVFKKGPRKADPAELLSFENLTPYMISQEGEAPKGLFPEAKKTNDYRAANLSKAVKKTLPFLEAPMSEGKASLFEVALLKAEGGSLPELKLNISLAAQSFAKFKKHLEHSTENEQKIA